MSDFATSAGHWYALDGTPRYTIVGKNGKERNTTLRDAREHQLVPSVTTVIKMAAAPSLEKWKRNQVLLAALTLPRRIDETEADWLSRVEQDWQEIGRKAADRGTEIHAAIEKHYRGQMPDEDCWPWVKAAREAITETCGEQSWQAERSFASPLGYGGKNDLYSPHWLLDFKSKEGDPTADIPGLFDEHVMQLAAYRRGLGVPNARCGIVFVGREIPKAIVVEAGAAHLTQGLAMFDALLAYWQAKASYWPGKVAA